MRLAPESHRRKPLRLPGYDYCRPGYYFVTVCTQDRHSLFGTVAHETMNLNQYGRIARDCWIQLPEHFSTVQLDAYVIMPDHMHGIVVITDIGSNVGPQHAAALHSKPSRHYPMVRPGSLGAIIRSFKSAVTRNINRASLQDPFPIWQYRYNERIIRDEPELNRIRRYILNNPKKWRG